MKTTPASIPTCRFHQRTRTPFRAAAVLILLSMSLPSHATLIFEDYFNYGTSNSDLGANSPWTQSTNNVRYREAANLSFSNPSYDVTSDNTGTGGADTSGNSSRISVAPVSETALTGEVWVSFLLRPRTGNSDPASDTYTALNLGTGNSIGFDNNSYNTSTSFGFFADDDDGLRLRPFIATGNSGDFGTTRTLGSSTLSTGDVTFLVLARAQVATSTLDVWFFEEGDTFGTTVAGLGAADVTTSSALLANITRVGIGKTGNGRGEFDVLRLSNTAGDAGLQAVIAIPEPGTLALVGISLGSLLLFRRRR